MDERPADAEAPLETEATTGDDTPSGTETPEYAEPGSDEIPFDSEAPDAAGQSLDEPPSDLDRFGYADFSVDEEPPSSLEQIDYDDLMHEGVAQDVDLGTVEAEPEEHAGPADVKLEAYTTTIPATEEPSSGALGSAALYQAFMPRRIRRDRVAAMPYPSAIELVSRQRKRGRTAALGELDMSDEEIAAAIQDYARGVDTDEERTNWLLGQILEEQQRQTRHLRGVRTVLILLIAALALAAIASCVLTFVQFPNLAP